MNEIPQPPSTNPFGSYQPTIEDRRVGFGTRLGAWLLDLIGLWLLTIPLAIIFRSMDLPQTDFLRESLQEMFQGLKQYGLPRELLKDIVPLMLPMLYAGIVGPLLYWALEAFSGASPGKRLLKLYIAREDGASAEPSIIAMRTIIKTSESILKLIAIFPVADVVARGITSAASLVEIAIVIGCFLALSAKKQALHDVIAHTAVFRTEETF